MLRTVRAQCLLMILSVFLSACASAPRDYSNTTADSEGMLVSVSIELPGTDPQRPLSDCVVDNLSYDGVTLLDKADPDPGFQVPDPTATTLVTGGNLYLDSVLVSGLIVMLSPDQKKEMAGGHVILFKSEKSVVAIAREEYQAAFVKHFLEFSVHLEANDKVNTYTFTNVSVAQENSGKIDNPGFRPMPAPRAGINFQPVYKVLNDVAGRINVCLIGAL